MPERKRAIALGFFDGVHAGHGELLKKTRERAEEIGGIASVLSFDVHPDTLVFNTDVPLINSAIGRKELIKRCYGIENVIFIHFNRHVMCMPWREFIDSLITEMNVGWIVIGHDFSCGYRGEGRADRIKEYCAGRGVGCDVIPALSIDGIVVSSTYIRKLIAEGNIERANRFLGHPHTLSDTVHSGYHLGTRLGTPTINMYFPEGVLVPKYGVYAAKVYLDHGESYISVTNVGIRPTVGDNNRVNVESHLLDYSGNLYGRQARVEFYSYIRQEKKFDSFDALSEQIKADGETARKYFDKLNN
ncbi:MAG: bifunctional riboflavin kinase/FAD synthetase [Candidatus Limivicinus sp.]|jgi:riboflavin kinase/FMN adenylyltransferase